MNINRTHKHSYFPIKRTTLEHQLLICFKPDVLMSPVGTSKGPFLTHQIIDSKILVLDTLNLSWSTRVLVQHYLVDYWEIFHHVYHAISGEYVCSNHCLLQFPVCITLCHMGILFFIESSFCTFDQSRRKCCTIS